jgi:hypothetical protein
MNALAECVGSRDGLEGLEWIHPQKLGADQNPKDSQLIEVWTVTWEYEILKGPWTGFCEYDSIAHEWRKASDFVRLGA